MLKRTHDDAFPEAERGQGPPSLRRNTLSLQTQNLMEAAQTGDTIRARTAIALGADINGVNSQGQSVLHIAVRHRQSAIIAILVGSPGIDLNQAPPNGNTALHIAARRGEQDIFNRLLYAPSINANLQDRNGYTAHDWLDRMNDVRNTAANSERISSFLRVPTNEHFTYFRTRPAPSFQGTRQYQNAGSTSASRQRPVAPLNGMQSTDTVSVLASVSKSAKALKEAYKNANLEAARKAFFAWGEDLVPEDQSPTNKTRAAKACIKRLPNYKTFFDKGSDVNMLDAIALVYLASVDADEIKKHLTDPTPEAVAQLKQVRLTTLIAHLYEAQRGYNIDENGKDDGADTDASVCTNGHFNKIISAAVGMHPAVEIYYVNRASINCKAIALFDEIFNALSDIDKTAYIKELDVENDKMPTPVLSTVKEKLKDALQREFEAHISKVDKGAAIIQEIVAAIKDFDTPALKRWQARLHADSNLGQVPPPYTPRRSSAGRAPVTSEETARRSPSPLN